MQTTIVRSEFEQTQHKPNSNLLSGDSVDVLEGLYRGLRDPIKPDVLERFDNAELAALFRLSEVQHRHLPVKSRSAFSLYKIDHLANRCRFLGIWPAEWDEVPNSWLSEEVFVVEVDLSEG